MYIKRSVNAAEKPRGRLYSSQASLYLAAMDPRISLSLWLPSLSCHDLLAIWHAHAVWMCVSIKILLLLEVATEALALGYRTIFVL